jgi:CO dehydrogenase/acetyl-CoA synthase epsilon subunit
MKTKKQIKEKDFDAVKTFRAIKEKISKDIVDMNLQQIQAYLKDKKLRLNK